MSNSCFRQKIAFADYKGEEDAKCARDYLQGYVFPNSDKGMCIRISENSKRKMPGAGSYAPPNGPHHKREDKRNFQPMHGGGMSKSSPENKDLDRGQDYPDRRKQDMGYPDRMGRKEQRGYYKSPDIHEQPHHGDPRVKQDNYGYAYDNRGRDPQYDDQPRVVRNSNVMSGGGNMPQQSFLHNPLANSRQDNKMKQMNMGHAQNIQSLDQINDNLDIHQNPSHNQDGYILNDMIQSQSMGDLMTMPGNSEGASGISHLDQYALPRNASNSIDSQGMNPSSAYMSNANGVQSIPMNNVAPPNSNSGGRVSMQYAQMPQNSSSSSGWGGGVATTSMYNQSVPNYMDALIDVCEQFHNILPIPKNATNTVYVEGIPFDAKEREIARKSAFPNSL